MTRAPLIADQPLALALDDRILLCLDRDTARIARLGDIRYLATCDNASVLGVGLTGEHLVLPHRLQTWLERLPGDYFVRVHPQTIVNVAHAHSLIRATESVSHLALDGLDHPVPVSRQYLAALRQRLGGHNP